MNLITCTSLNNNNIFFINLNTNIINQFCILRYIIVNVLCFKNNAMGTQFITAPT